MKKRIVIAVAAVFAAALLILSAGTAGERDTMIETLVPGKTLLFMKSSQITRLVKSIRFVVDTFLPEQYRKVFDEKLSAFSKKSGINPMNVDSLRKAGVDVDREMALVYMKEDEQKNEQVLIYLPVFNENRFPLTFVEFLNQMVNSDNKLDLYPVITNYRDHKIYQVNSGVFATAMEGYFIVGSTGNLIRTVINIAEGGEGNLASVDDYVDFIRKFTGSCDVKIYASGELFKEVFNNRVKKKLPATPQDNSRVMDRGSIHTVQFQKDGTASPLLKMAPKKNFPYKYIHYLAAGVDVTEKNVELNIAASLNRKMEGIDDILDVFKTGAVSRALYLPDSMAYSFVSIDPGHVVEMFEKYPNLNSLYTAMTGKLRERFGISFAKDFVPNINGMITMVTGQTTGFGDLERYAVFFSMDKSSRVKRLYRKVMKNIIKKTGDTGNFSEVQLEKADGFSMSGLGSKKKYVAADGRGFYLGSDLGLVKDALKGKEFASVGSEVRSGLGVRDSLFMYSHAKRESYITAMIMLVQMTGKPELSGLFQKLGDISMTGEKLGSFMSINIDVGIK